MLRLRTFLSTVRMPAEKSGAAVVRMPIALGYSEPLADVPDPANDLAAILSILTSKSSPGI